MSFDLCFESALQ